MSCQSCQYPVSHKIFSLMNKNLSRTSCHLLRILENQTAPFTSPTFQSHGHHRLCFCPFQWCSDVRGSAPALPVPRPTRRTQRIILSCHCLEGCEDPPPPLRVSLACQTWHTDALQTLSWGPSVQGRMIPPEIQHTLLSADLQLDTNFRKLARVSDDICCKLTNNFACFRFGVPTSLCASRFTFLQNGCSSLQAFQFSAVSQDRLSLALQLARRDLKQQKLEESLRAQRKQDKKTSAHKTEIQSRVAKAVREKTKKPVKVRMMLEW